MIIMKFKYDDEAINYYHSFMDHFAFVFDFLVAFSVLFFVFYFYVADDFLLVPFVSFDFFEEEAYCFFTGGY